MTKDTVLAMLRQADGYLSGEQISGSLGVSRAAVHTAVKSLRAEGYDIHSLTNRGYRLGHAPDRLSRGELLAELSGGRMEHVLCLEEVDSTNNRLREWAHRGAAEGSVVIANHQRAGKGRLGRRFESPKDQGVYLSMLLRPTLPPADAATLTAWVAVAVCRAVEAVCGARPDIKWVNDIVMNGQKLGGVLTELSAEAESGQVQFVVVGIGLNVSQSRDDFPGDIRDMATSLREATGGPVRRARLAAALIRELDRLRDDFPHARDAYLSAYRQSCLTLGRQVRVLRGGVEKQGVARGVDERFALLVDFSDGTCEALSSGEVSVRGLYGYV
ncbi:MAG: biotin--[acetyl-CoA-carboxylase] ligase [Eubacteriales bacterium]